MSKKEIEELLEELYEADEEYMSYVDLEDWQHDYNRSIFVLPREDVDDVMKRLH